MQRARTGQHEPGTTACDDFRVTSLERLTTEDARILHLESATIAGHTCKVAILERVPGVTPTDAVRRRVAERLSRVPRCRQRVVPTPGRRADPCWSDDEEFAVERHVRSVATDRVVSRRELLELVGQIMAGRLDRDRPLWSIDVVDALDDGRWALVWRIHHCMADGMTAMRWASDLLWDDQPAAVSTPPAASSTAPAPSSTGREPERRRRALEVTRRDAAAIAREVRPTEGRSPFAGPTGTRREVAFARWSLDEMRAIGQLCPDPATINDVLLAVVAGGIRTWLTARDAPLHTIRIKVPVSMHTAPGADHLGNRDSFLFVDVPLVDPDPLARLHAIHGETTERKERRDAQALYSVFDALDHVAPLGRAATRIAMSPHVFAVNVSNVPGPRRARTMHGGRVEELYSLAEIAPKHALRVSAVSLAAEMFVGLNVEPTVVADVGVLASGIEAAVAELLSCGPR